MAKMALVTGGSEGIGRAFAKRLIQDGYTVTIVSRSETKLREAATKLGQNCTYVVADLSTREGQNKIVQELENKKFDLLVNNAGIGTVGGFTEVTFDRQMQMFHLNCEA